MNENREDMRICPKCGAMISRDNLFCTNCGTKMDQMEQPQMNYDNQQPAQFQPQYQQPQQKQPLTPEEMVMKKKKMKRIGIIGGIAVVACIVIAIVVHFASYKTIDCAKIYDIKFEGYDTKGTADVDIDTTEVLKLFGLSKDDSLYDLEDKGEEIADRYHVISGLDVTIDKEEDLKNGDKVKITVDYDKEECEEAKIKIKNATRTVTVSGLKKTKTQNDLFKNVDVTFSGSNGYGTARIDRSNAGAMLYTCVEYTFDKDTKLSNGDKVTVTATADVDEAISLYGTKLKSSAKKTFVVEGLTSLYDDDIFADMNVVYQGSDDQVTASVEASSKMTDMGVTYSLDKETGLKAGDEITVTATYDADKAAEKGHTFSVTTKKITVPEATKCFRTSEGINFESAAKKIDDYAKNKAEANNGSAIGNTIHIAVKAVKKREVVKSYFISNNKNSGADDSNMYIRVYKYLLDTEQGEKEYYACFILYNLEKDGDKLKFQNDNVFGNLYDVSEKSYEDFINGYQEKYTIQELEN